MIPVVQTKVVVRNSKDEIVVNGNCYAAAIASIMELPITEVPNVEVFYHLNNGYYQEVMHTFLESKGWELCSDDRYKVFHPELHSQLRCPRDRDFDDWAADMRMILEDNYYFVSGPSARGVSHITIYKAGEMVHDPHPTKDGILQLLEFQSLQKVK